jgi:hypothetical protein
MYLCDEIIKILPLSLARTDEKTLYDKEGEELKYGRMITPLWPTGS